MTSSRLTTITAVTTGSVIGILAGWVDASHPTTTGLPAPTQRVVHQSAPVRLTNASVPKAAKAQVDQTSGDGTARKPPANGDNASKSQAKPVKATVTAERAQASKSPPTKPLPKSAAAKRRPARTTPAELAHKPSRIQARPVASTNRTASHAAFELLDNEFELPTDIPIASREQLLEAERDCGLNVADECLRASDAYEAGEVTSTDPKRSRRYGRQAISLYAEECNNQDPKACYQLARLYAEGDGVKVDQRNVKALIQRTQQLCSYRRLEFCDKLKARR